MTDQTIEHEGSTEVPPKEKRVPVIVEDNSSFQNLMDTDRFAQMWRVATMFAKSEMVPADFRGKPENCMIIVEQAMRLDLAPFMMLQHTYIVHGKPGMSAQLVIALVNQNGPFDGPIQFKLSGSGDTRKCRAFATHAKTGDVCEQTVSMKIAKDEGWLDKNGSKWKTIPDLMLQYRSAAWLGRVFAPECLMGMQTHEELLDSDPDMPHVGFKRAKVINPEPTSEPPDEAAAAPEPEKTEEVTEAEVVEEAPEGPVEGEAEPADETTERDEKLETDPLAEEEPVKPAKRPNRKTVYNELLAKVETFTDYDDLANWTEEVEEFVAYVRETLPEYADEIDTLIKAHLKTLSE